MERRYRVFEVEVRLRANGPLEDTFTAQAQWALNRVNEEVLHVWVERDGNSNGRRLSYWADDADPALRLYQLDYRHGLVPTEQILDARSVRMARAEQRRTFMGLVQGGLKGFGMARRPKKNDYGDGIWVQFSPVNSAWFGMWHDQVLKVGTEAEVRHWATQLTTPNVELLGPRRDEQARVKRQRARAQAQETLESAFETMAQDPGFIALRKQREAEAKAAKLKAGWQKFPVGSSVRYVGWPGADPTDRPWPGKVVSAEYREHDIDGAGWYYEVKWWNAKLRQYHEDYLHQDQLRAEGADLKGFGAQLLSAMPAFMKRESKELQQLDAKLRAYGFVPSYTPPRDPYNREPGYHYEFPPGGVYSGENRDKDWILVVVNPKASSILLTERVMGRPGGYQQSRVRSRDAVGIDLLLRDVADMMVAWDERLVKGGSGLGGASSLAVIATASRHSGRRRRIKPEW